MDVKMAVHVILAAQIDSGEMSRQITFFDALLLFGKTTTLLCVCVFLLTLAFRAKRIIWVWSESHLDRSMSTSPKKLFLPNVS